MKKIRIVNRKKFFFNIIIPTFMTAIMFIILIFAIIMPYFRHHLIEAKKEMIKEIVNSAMCIADMYYLEAQEGKITFEEAQNLTINTLESIRYGTDNKDYLWITDDVPILIMHPYKANLIGKNVAEYKDPNGKRMFSEMVSVATKSSEGYVDYMWQWMDDSTRIVPKISYIKQNDNWNWIIGTGVYIEDIRISIRTAINNLIWTSLGIFLVVSFLLTIIVKRNLMVERKRSLAEQSLKESNEKYKTLVEASSDGTLMFINGECIFANKKVHELFDGNLIEFINPTLDSIVDKTRVDDIMIIKEFLANNKESIRLETKIIGLGNISKNVLLSYSKISFSGTEAIIVTIKDLTIDNFSDEYNAELIETFKSITEKLDIGVFRAANDRKGTIIALNENLLKTLGYEDFEDISKVGMFTLFDDSQERKEFLSSLNSKGQVKEFLCRVRRKDGNISQFLVNAVFVRRIDNTIEFIDGITVDYSLSKKNEYLQEELLATLMNFASIWDMPVESLTAQDIPICKENITIAKALELMNFYKTEVLVASISNHNIINYISKNQIINSIISSEFSIENSISDYLQNPDEIHTKSSTIFDIIIYMLRSRSNFTLVRFDEEVKIIYLYDLIQIFNSNTKFLTNRLKLTTAMEDLILIHDELPIYITNYVKVGTDITIITNTITAVSDTISKLIIDKAISQCGTPPCKFAFIALGSEGRSEQGLTTDQDNAIIFEDVEESDFQRVFTYFQDLAEIVNILLDKAGYKLCIGDIMAKNPKWCQPLLIWKNYFNNWIKVPNPQSLLDSSIFFDFRCIYGENELADNLREHIKLAIKQNPAFLNQHAIMTINYKLPVSIFGKIQTESKEEQSNVFNLKNAIRLLVNMVRLYAMKHSISETNTLKRLQALYDKNFISQSHYREVEYCFKFLMNMQFQEQTKKYLRGTQIDNFLDLSVLSPTKLSNLKNVLGSTAQFQSKVKYDFGVSDNM